MPSTLPTKYIQKLSTSSAVTLVQATIISCLDYCNSSYPVYLFFPPFTIQTTLKRTVRKILPKCKSDHVILMLQTSSAFNHIQEKSKILSNTYKSVLVCGH